MYSILYVADGEIMSAGPFKTEAEADKYVRQHSYPQKDYEFDVAEQRVYLLIPDHGMREYSCDFVDPPTEKEMDQLWEA